jgi:hypothetical protein
VDWVEVRGFLCVTLGKLPSEVGEMTMPDVNLIFDYCDRHPPVHVLVAAYLGVKPKSGPQAGGMSPDQLVAMLAPKMMDKWQAIKRGEAQ